MRGFPVLAALCAALCCWSAKAAEPKVGTPVETVVEIAGKQVPLPAGQWVVAGIADTDLPNGDPVGAYGAIRNLVLFRIGNGIVDTVLELNVNELPVTAGWGLAGDCLRTDLALALVRYQTGSDASCLFVTHTVAAGPDLPAAWRHAAAFAADADLVLPVMWLTSGHRVANRRDVIDARFHFAPETRGVPPETATRWADSAWHASRLTQDPNRLAAAAAVGRWAPLYQGYLEAGLKGVIDPARLDLPMPGTVEPQGVAGQMRERLVILAGLRRAGVLSDDQLQRQLQSIRDHGPTSGPPPVDGGAVALQKAVTYRSAMALAGYGLGLLGFAEAATVWPLVLLRGGIDTATFYLHEMAWGKYGTPAGRDSARPIDFVYLGSDG
ncbi:MAG: hypothetical protein U1E45_20720 [Geminicoccaceae bacterium]